MNSGIGSRATFRPGVSAFIVAIDLHRHAIGGPVTEVTYMDDDVAAELKDPMMDDPTDLRNTKDQVMNFIYEIPFYSRALHKWEK